MIRMSHRRPTARRRTRHRRPLMRRKACTSLTQYPIRASSLDSTRVIARPTRPSPCSCSLLHRRRPSKLDPHPRDYLSMIPLISESPAHRTQSSKLRSPRASIPSLVHTVDTHSTPVLRRRRRPNHILHSLRLLQLNGPHVRVSRASAPTPFHTHPHRRRSLPHSRLFGAYDFEAITSSTQTEG